MSFSLGKYQMIKTQHTLIVNKLLLLSGHFQVSTVRSRMLLGAETSFQSHAFLQNNVYSYISLRSRTITLRACITTGRKPKNRQPIRLSPGHHQIYALLPMVRDPLKRLLDGVQAFPVFFVQLLGVNDDDSIRAARYMQRTVVRALRPRKKPRRNSPFRLQYFTLQMAVWNDSKFHSPLSRVNSTFLQSYSE